jgi:hypothetical protein
LVFEIEGLLPVFGRLKGQTDQEPDQGECTERRDGILEQRIHRVTAVIGTAWKARQKDNPGMDLRTDTDDYDLSERPLSLKEAVAHLGGNAATA